MPQTCTVCTHRDRQAIEAALFTRTSSLRDLGKQYKVGFGAIHRHVKNCMARAIDRVQARTDDSLQNAITGELRALVVRATRIMDKSEAEADGRLTLGAIREIRDTLGALYKVVGDSHQNEAVMRVEIIHVGELVS